MAPNHLHSRGEHSSPDPTDACYSKEPECICNLGYELGQVCRDAYECMDAPRIWAWDACLRASSAGCSDEHDQQCHLCEWYGQASLCSGPRALQPGAERRHPQLQWLSA